MTYAPVSIIEVRAYLKGEDHDLDNAELGITGGPSHVATGTSYHLGKDQLKMSKNPYSARTVRDKAGLADAEIANAANALDVDDDLDELRPMSVWIVEQCRAGAADTLDLREVIYSPDGVQVLQWDRERGQNSVPQPHPDLSHREHSHFSWYRDSTRRGKVGLFQRYFASVHRKVPDMFFLKVSTGDEIYVSDGLNTRLLPGGQWSLTGEPLVKAGVPLLVYPSLPALLDGGGPMAKELDAQGVSEEELRAIMREEIAKTRLV